MCDTCHIVQRELRDVKAILNRLADEMKYNAGKNLMGSWVSKELAQDITGLGYTALMQRVIRKGKDGTFNPKGIFHTKPGKKGCRFYLPDLQKYEKKVTLMDIPAADNVFFLKKSKAV